MEDGWRVPARKFTRQQNFNETASLRTPTPFSSYYPSASDSPPPTSSSGVQAPKDSTPRDVDKTRRRLDSRGRGRGILSLGEAGWLHLLGIFPLWRRQEQPETIGGKLESNRTGTSARSFEKALTSAWPRAMISSLSAPAKVSQGATAAPLSGKLTVARTTVDSPFFESCRQNTRHVQPRKKFKHFRLCDFIGLALPCSDVRSVNLLIEC